MGNDSKTDEILAERGPVHGDAGAQFLMAQKLKSIVGGELDNKTNIVDDVLAEAMSMILVKVSRVSVGDENHIDHWDDIAGYATLAANHLREKG